MMQYSILSFLFNDYEILREPVEVSPNCEYVLVTDNPHLVSSKWHIKYLPNALKDADGFTKSFYVRYHPFEFVSTPICCIIDGSVLIKKSIDKLISVFERRQSDTALMVHFSQINAYDEYPFWVQNRGYSPIQAAKSIAFMEALGYPKTYKGTFEAGFRICRNNTINHQLNNITYMSLQHIGRDELHIERVDQCIFSAIVNTKFTQLNVLPVTRQIIQNPYMQYCYHQSTRESSMPIDWSKMYLFDKPTKVFLLN